jgi:GT2 family glycosyltransferase
MVTREAFDKVGGFDPQLKVGEDWDFCYRVAREYKVGFVPEPLVNYRSHGKNAHNNVAEMERGMSIFYKKAFNEGDSEMRSLRPRVYGNLHKILAGSSFQAGKYLDFLRHAAISMWLTPANLLYFAQFPIRRLRKTQKTAQDGK